MLFCPLWSVDTACIQYFWALYCGFYALLTVSRLSRKVSGIMKKPIDESSIKLEGSWKELLKEEFQADYLRALRAFLAEETASGKKLYPRGSEVFGALNSTPFDQVKVVILGQDPYHGPGQAHGLSFSVPRGVPAPPSLQNIYRELKSDLDVRDTGHGCLESWARQVLLLNSVLTVECGKAASHQNRGLERFTDRIMSLLSERHENLVFLLWGSYAQKKGAVIDGRRHCVLKAPHPSPLSAYRGFFGCGHFSKANAFLTAKNRGPIDWQLPQ